MVSEGSSEYDELSEYSYETPSAASTATVDTLDELLQRFTLDCRPDCTLKLRNKVGPVVLGADLAYATANSSGSGSLVVKPSSLSAPWRRLKMDSTGTLTLRSRKLSWWVFTLDLHGHANPFKKTTDVSFRVATKWDISAGEIKKKRRVALNEGAEGRVHWSVNYSMPAIEGSLGTQQERDIHADLGYAHLSIPRLEMVVWPQELKVQQRKRGVQGGARRAEGGPAAEEARGGLGDGRDAAGAEDLASVQPELDSIRERAAHAAQLASMSSSLAGAAAGWRQGWGRRSSGGGGKIVVGEAGALGRGACESSGVRAGRRLAVGDIKAHIFQLAHC